MHAWDDIAITKPIHLLNRSGIMTSRQYFQCYDATGGTAFWQLAEEHALRLIVQ